MLVRVRAAALRGLASARVASRRPPSLLPTAQGVQFAGRCGFGTAFCPTGGPDAPHTEDAARVAQPRWPAGWHDHLQYHFFFEDIFVQARVFLTPSLEEHSLWIFDHAEGKVVELVNSSEKMRQEDGDHLSLTSPQLKIDDGPGGGSLSFNGSELVVDFHARHVFSWLPGGQAKDAVIHRPDLELTLSYRGQTRKGRGYSKRYYGAYGPHWGYRFIQSSWLKAEGGPDKFLWTADATFRLGDGEAKYNYFKLLDGKTGSLVQANSQDTYQQDCDAYAEIDGRKYQATVTPLGEWMHDYKAGDTNSRMQLRYCKVVVTRSDAEPNLEGYALNERCFGVL